MFGLQSTPLVQQPAQRTAAALSRDVGTFADWAALQAAYPNGSAALAALPAGATAWVAEWGARFAPNAAKTFWRPLHMIWIGGFNTDITQLEATSTAETLAYAVTIPPKLLQAGSRVLCPWAAFVPSNASSKTGRMRIDTSATGVTGTTIGGLGATTSTGSAHDVQFVVRSTTSQIYNTSTTGFFGTSGTSGDLAIDTDANPIYAKLTLQVAASGVSMTAKWFSVFYVPGSAA